MKAWTTAYHRELKAQFTELTTTVPTRLRQVTDGRTTPTLEGVPLGSARKLDAAVLFFDIEGFTTRTASDDDAELHRTLAMLNYVIPSVMRVIYDHDGIIEKNTGDGVMAIFADGSPDEIVANALDAAVTVFHVMREIVTPHLESIGIRGVDARIGVDYGNLLISKMGVPTGSADHQRNFLVAVGPTANIACRLQEMAGTNQIFVGNNVYRHTLELRRDVSMRDVTPPVTDWNWVYKSTNARYGVWHFTEVRVAPVDLAALAALSSLFGRPSQPPLRGSLGALMNPRR